MEGAASSLLDDLLAATEAVGEEERIRSGGADGGQEDPLAAGD
jgi:hypothetical protein